MEVAILAALAMVTQDIFEVLKDQAQVRNRAILAGLFDSLMWLAVITTTAISVTILQGHSLSHKILVVGLVTIANFVGQGTGVLLGQRLIKENHGPNSI
jgi:hypothetical protein